MILLPYVQVRMGGWSADMELVLLVETVATVLEGAGRV